MRWNWQLSSAQAGCWASGASSPTLQQAQRLVWDLQGSAAKHFRLTFSVMSSEQDASRFPVGSHLIALTSFWRGEGERTENEESCLLKTEQNWTQNQYLRMQCYSVFITTVWRRWFEILAQILTGPKARFQERVQRPRLNQTVMNCRKWNQSCRKTFDLDIVLQFELSVHKQMLKPSYFKRCAVKEVKLFIILPFQEQNATVQVTHLKV